MYVSVLAVFASTNDIGNEEDTEKFYQELQLFVKTPKQDRLMIMGGFNVHVGNEGEVWHGAIGRLGPVEQNRNGAKLPEFLRTLLIQTYKTLLSQKKRIVHE